MIGIEQVDHRSRVADRDILGPTTENLHEIGTFLNDPESTPGFAPVLGPLENQIDLACVPPLPGLAKSEQMTVRSLYHGGNPVNPVPILTRLEYGLPLQDGEGKHSD